MTVAFTSIDTKDSDWHPAASVSTIDTEVEVSSFGHGNRSALCCCQRDADWSTIPRRDPSTYRHSNCENSSEIRVPTRYSNPALGSFFRSVSGSVPGSNSPIAARSSDLSPIEHSWDVLGQRVRDAYLLPLHLLRISKTGWLPPWNSATKMNSELEFRPTGYTRF